MTKTDCSENETLFKMNLKLLFTVISFIFLLNYVFCDDQEVKTKKLSEEKHLKNQKNGEKIRKLVKKYPKLLMDPEKMKMKRRGNEKDYSGYDYGYTYPGSYGSYSGYGYSGSGYPTYGSYYGSYYGSG